MYYDVVYDKLLCGVSLRRVSDVDVCKMKVITFILLSLENLLFKYAKSKALISCAVTAGSHSPY